MDLYVQAIMHHDDKHLAYIVSPLNDEPWIVFTDTTLLNAWIVAQGHEPMTPLQIKQIHHGDTVELIDLNADDGEDIPA